MSEIELAEATPVVEAIPALPTEREWVAMERAADVMSKSGLVPKSYRGKPNDIISAALFGRTLGFDLPTSLRYVSVIEGKPALGAEAIVALIHRAGHSLRVVEMTSQRATGEGRRADTGDTMAYTYTIEMAKRAGLASKAVWRSYPEAMCWARVASQIGRSLFPDVLLGCSYTPEELGADADGSEPIIVHEHAPDTSGETIEVRADREELLGRVRLLTAAEQDRIRAALKDMGVSLAAPGATPEQLAQVRDLVDQGVSVGDVLDAEIVEQVTPEQAEWIVSMFNGMPDDERKAAKSDFVAEFGRPNEVTADRLDDATAWLNARVEPFPVDTEPFDISSEAA